MSNTAHEDKSASPIIEIVEWLNDDDELISSFTKDLSLSQQNLDKLLPSQTSEELQTHSRKRLDSKSPEIGNIIDDKLTNSVKDSDLNAKKSIIAQKANDQSTPNTTVKTKAAKKVQFHEEPKSSPVLDDKIDLLLQPARVLRFRQRLSGYEPTLNRFSNKSKDNTLPNPSKILENADAGESGDIDHDFETVLLDLKHEQAKRLNLEYKTKIYQNSSSKERDLHSEIKSTIVEKPDANDFHYDSDGEFDEAELLYLLDDPDAHLYFQSDDLDQMVRDYDLGLFDDDSKLNVVEKLEDFEHLNAILEATQSTSEVDGKNTEQSGVLEDNGASILSNLNGKNSISELLDTDVMADDVIENDVADDSYDEEMGFYDYDDVEKNVLDQDIKLNYFRLKRKLFPTRGQDEEIEPL